MANLIILLDLPSDKNDKESYSVTLWNDSEKKEIISTIDFKSDNDYNNINKVNEFLLVNVDKYDKLEINQSSNLANLLKEFDDFKKIIETVTKIWIEEFNEVKDELKKIKDK